VVGYRALRCVPLSPWPHRKIENSITEISKERGFAKLVEEHVPKAIGQIPTVVDSRYPGRTPLQLDPSDPPQCLGFYRRVRHNATQRGKSGPDRDIKLLDESLTQLIPIFRGVIRNARQEAEVDKAQVFKLQAEPSLPTWVEASAS
jgi:hypothetical protein